MQCKSFALRGMTRATPDLVHTEKGKLGLGTSGRVHISHAM
jgi:hypothetical protein